MVMYILILVDSSKIASDIAYAPISKSEYFNVR